MGIFDFFQKTSKKYDANDPNLILLDVRTSQEFDSDHAEKSINIPLDLLESKLNTLSKDKTIIVVCASGMRSSAAIKILKNAGFEKIENGVTYRNFKNW